VFQRRAGFRGVWIPVLDEWSPRPGLLAHASCFTSRHGKGALYLALIRDLGERLGPIGGAFGKWS
jgi:hypothetical protein